MINKLILLAGTAGTVTPPDPEPITAEPYRVIWNPLVIYNDQARYFKHEPHMGYASVALNTAVLTDHEPLTYEPEMLIEDYLPIDTTLVGYPIITASRPQYTIIGMRINNISNIAAANRTGKLPKVFQTSLVSTNVFEEMDLIRYNLNEDGTRFVALRIARTTESITVRLRWDASGTGPIISAPVTILENPVGTVVTDTLRLVMFDDYFCIYHGEPGTEIARVPAYEPRSVDPLAHLLLINEDYRQNGQSIPVIYGLTGLYIYDGYY